MNTYIFHAERIIDANSEEEACEKFADSSFDFAADAECEIAHHFLTRFRRRGDRRELMARSTNALGLPKRVREFRTNCSTRSCTGSGGGGVSNRTVYGTPPRKTRTTQW